MEVCRQAAGPGSQLSIRRPCRIGQSLASLLRVVVEGGRCVKPQSAKSTDRPRAQRAPPRAESVSQLLS